ncbi:MAG: DNA-binding protein WhiA [Candidatus Atribacteria bacterium]|nr:DNA-binding protein WhiA [Candidatus Atribacteria bacterium]
MDFRTFLKDEIYAQTSSSLLICRGEWWGIFRGGGVIKRREDNSYLSFSHTDLSLIKKCLWLKNKLYPHLTHLLLQEEKRGINAGKWYSLDIFWEESFWEEGGFGDILVVQDMLKGKVAFAFLRGLFEARGYISDPLRHHHLEIGPLSSDLAFVLLSYLEKKDLPFQLRERKKETYIYTKNSSVIGSFLHHLGASQAYLQWEKLAIEKSTLNHLTRWVNWETANLGRTVDSSLRQRQKLQEVDLNSLPSRLREVAHLRLEHPYASLREIGNFCSPPLSKSGVHHRLREIEKIIEEQGKK